jgi:hypothetical protein
MEYRGHKLEARTFRAKARRRNKGIFGDTRLDMGLLATEKHPIYWVGSDVVDVYANNPRVAMADAKAFIDARLSVLDG